MAGAAQRVLVVDDERFFRDAIRDALAGLAVTCDFAATGDEALKLAEDPAIDAVVLDVRLPGISGIDVLRTLRKERPELCVIVLSAASDQELVIEALRLGASDYLAKPIHEEELRLAVTRAVQVTHRTRRWDALRGRLDRLPGLFSALEEVARDVGLEKRLETLAPHAVECVSELLSASRASLLVGTADSLRVAGIVGGDLGTQDLSPLPTIESVAGLAFGADHVLRIEDIDRDERCAGLPRRGRYATGSALLGPLEAGGEPYGVLCVADPLLGRPFADEDASLLSVFAGQFSALLAMPTAEAPASAEPAASPDPEPVADPEESLRVDLVRAVCEALTQEVEPEPLLRAALAPVSEQLDAVVSLYLLDGRSGEAVLEAQRTRGARCDRARLPRDRGLTSLVLQTGRLIAADRPEDDARFDPDVDTPEDGASGPLLCLPLAVRGKVLGLARVFPAPEIGASARTGEMLASALSAAIRNVLLYRSLLESIEDVARARRRGSQRAG